MPELGVLAESHQVEAVVSSDISPWRQLFLQYMGHAAWVWRIQLIVGA